MSHREPASARARNAGHGERRGDPELVRACLDGREDAWRELVMRHGRLVLGVARHAGLGDADVQDVFQEVFAALLRQLAGLRDHQSLVKWLITTTHRLALRQAQRSRRDPAVPGVPGPDEEAPADVVMRWERQHLVRQALQRLGGRCRELLEALYLDQGRPTYDQVAARLGMPRGSVGPTRVRCLARLVELLRDAGTRGAG